MNKELVQEIRESGKKYEPDSSTIKTMTYHPERMALIVDFKSGGSYLYTPVTHEVWEEILKSESAGKMFHEKIKKTNTPWEKLEAQQAGSVDPGLMLGVVAALIISFLLFGLVRLAAAQDGLPEPDRSNLFTVNLCYTNELEEAVCEPFSFPSLIRDFGPIGYITASPEGAGRDLLRLPTYAIARYHHWVFSEVLSRIQRDIAGCVDRIGLVQELVGYRPIIDSPYSPRLIEVVSQRDYLVPMDPIQRADGDYTKPPRLSDAIEHVIAAIYSINERVYYLGLCEEEARRAKELIQRRLQEGDAAINKLSRRKK